MTDHVDILLIEDNPADAEFVVESLETDGIAGRVFQVHDGVEALDFLFARGLFAHRKHEPPPRLVLLDIKLPMVDGFDVLGEIKSHPATRAIPVVMLTSSNVERDVARCYRLGVNSYVQKPMEFDQFRTVVRLIGRYWLTANQVPPITSAEGEGAPT